MQSSVSQPGSSAVRGLLAIGSYNGITTGVTRLCVPHYLVDRPGKILKVRGKVYRTSS